MADRLLHPPVPLCALVGVKEIHPAIINNMPNVKRLRLVSRELHEDFPKPKRKPEIKDWDSFKPKGILKSNWVEKHRTVIPAVATVLYEWDEGKDWHSQASLMASIVSNFRRKIYGRNVEIVVVIVRHRNALQDESGLDEKLRSIGNEVSISSRNILLLTTVDLKASLKRLEEHLHIVACKKYREIYKKVKRTRDRVPRTVKKLQVRCHFKMGFYAELYNDQILALSHYKSAYNYLAQIKVAHDSEAVIEVKAVAEVIVFKIVYLLLHMNRVSDALSQFRQHVKTFQSLLGIPSLAFHHHAWMSNQYRTFGEFWEEAPSAQRHSSKMQNSGYFYQSAAEYALKRKESAQHALEATGMAKLQPSTNVPNPEYLGQILTEAEHTYSQAAVGNNQIHKHVVLQRILLSEAKHEHSEGVLVLLTRAYENFKRHRCTRMILHVAYHMACEYLSVENYTMAKKFFDRIARTYRKEKWTPILSKIILRALQCAKSLGVRYDSVAYTLELLAPNLRLSNERKTALARDLKALSLNVPPPPVRLPTISSHR